VTDIKTTTLVNTRLTKPEVNLQKHSLLSCMGIGRGTGGALAPLDFEIISKKRLFFQFRGVQNKFHRFCPPLEKILPTPMLSCNNCGWL